MRILDEGVVRVYNRSYIRDMCRKTEIRFDTLDGAFITIRNLASRDARKIKAGSKGEIFAIGQDHRVIFVHNEARNFSKSQYRFICKRA